MKYMLSVYRFFFIVCFLMHGLPGFSQFPEPYGSAIAGYESEKEVAVKYNQTIEFKIEHDSVVMYSSHEEEIFYPSKPLFQPVSAVYYSDFIRVVDLEAGYYLPSDKKYKYHKKYYSGTEKIQSDGIFYDDNTLLKINYPVAEPGMVTRLSYKKKHLQSRFTNPFYFQSGIPVVAGESKIIVPDGIEIHIKTEGTLPDYVFFSEKKEKGKTIYSWHISKAPAFSSLQENAPEIAYFMPHVLYWVAAYEVQGKRKEMLETPAGLYQWLYNLTAKGIKEIPQQLQPVVDSLAAGCDNELCKVNKIFKWVQDNISYIAFEQGYSGYIPRTPEAIFRKKYGDCKDMSNMIRAMCKHLGIKVYLVWVGTRDIPYNVSEIPMPNVFNHMIAAYITAEDSVYYLDATSKYQPFGLPTDMIQGKNVLIGIDEDRYRIEQIPVMPVQASESMDSIRLYMENGKLYGQGKLTVNGYEKVWMNMYLDMKNTGGTRSVVENYLVKGNNKFKLVHYDIQNKGSRDEPLSITYDFSLENYASTVGDEIFVNLHLVPNILGTKIETKRTSPVFNRYNFSEQHIVVFDVPAGYEIVNLPAKGECLQELFGYKVELESSDRQVILKASHYIDYLLLEKEGFPLWNQMSEQFRQVQSRSLGLRKTIKD